MGTSKDPSPDLPGFNDVRLKQVSVSMEALNYLFQRMPFEKKIQFTDGRIGVVKPFFEPVFNENGALRAGIDVKIFEHEKQKVHNGHLEFILSLTGWGGDCPEGAPPGGAISPDPEAPPITT